jgi:hypothetical protein
MAGQIHTTSQTRFGASPFSPNYYICLGLFGMILQMFSKTHPKDFEDMALRTMSDSLRVLEVTI